MREWKEGGDAGGRRPGNGPVTQAPPVAVVAAPIGRRSDCGGSADKKGGGVTAAAAKAVNPSVLPKTTPLPAAAAAAGEPGDIRREDAAESSTEPDDTGLERGAPGAPALSAAASGERQASPPRPAPPAPPPPANGGSLSSKSSTSPTETKEDAGRGETRPGESEQVGVLETRVPPAGERVIAGGKDGSGGVEVGGGSRNAKVEVVAAAAAVAEAAAAVAEAAAEEAAAAKEAAADMAAMKAAAVVAAVTAAAKTAQSSPSALLPAPPPLAPVDARQPFVTPRKLRSPRPLDVFSSPPLAPVGSGRAVEEDDSEFSLDPGPALPPEKGSTRSREGLPPSGPANARSRGANASAFPLGAVERQLSMGVAGMSMVEAEAENREGVVAAAPPAFHDLVKRSTRFMTSGAKLLVWE